MEFEKDKMYILEYFFTEPEDSIFPGAESWTICPEEDIERNLINDSYIEEGFVIIKDVPKE